MPENGLAIISVPHSNSVNYKRGASTDDSNTLICTECEAQTKMLDYDSISFLQVLKIFEYIEGGSEVVIANKSASADCLDHILFYIEHPQYVQTSIVAQIARFEFFDNLYVQLQSLGDLSPDTTLQIV